jgi:hypothetical protein
VWLNGLSSFKEWFKNKLNFLSGNTRGLSLRKTQLVDLEISVNYYMQSILKMLGDLNMGKIRTGFDEYKYISIAAGSVFS